MDKRDLVIATYHRLRHVEKTARECHVSRKTVTQILNERGVIKYGKRIHFYDQNFFDEIDTEEKAYFLGYLWADGCNYPDTHTLSLELAEHDKAILDQFSILLKSEKPLSYRPARRIVSSKTGKIYLSQPLYTLIVYSKWMTDKLASYGMIRNKSPTLSMPQKIIKKTLMRHFIRGLFDGDGCICVHPMKNRKKPQIFSVFTAKNQNFAEEVGLVIEKAIGIKTALSNSGNITFLKLSSLRDQYIFLSWLYRGSSIRLERKYAKFQILKNRYLEFASTKTSKYRNILKRGARYQVLIKGVNLGYFATESEAAECLTKNGHTLKLAI